MDHKENQSPAQERKHNQLPVVDDEDRPVGILDVQDLVGTV